MAAELFKATYFYNS